MLSWLSVFFAGKPVVEFVLFLGDMVENPADNKDWEVFFDNKQPAFGDLEVYTTPGNFELPENGPVTSGDYENCHIVSLNSSFFMKERRKAVEYNDSGASGYKADVKAINDWLKGDLTSCDACWKIVFMHHPLYPVAEDDDIYGILRDNWEQIFLDCGVDVVFCVYQHVYARIMPYKGSESSGKPVYIMINSGQKRSKYVKDEMDIPACVNNHRKNNGISHQWRGITLFYC